MNNIKKSLWVSGLALLISIVMLVGTTFAWFTDSVINQGNVIQSGNLKISANGIYLSQNNSNQLWNTQINSINWGLKKPLIQQENWEPGQYDAVVVQISNFDSTLSANVALDFNITGEEGQSLTEALWYRLTPIPATFNNVNNSVSKDQLLQESQRRISSDDNVESWSVHKMSSIETDATEPVTLQGGQSSKGHDCYVFYLLEYGMYTDAGPEYMDKTFHLDITVKATQAPVEEDGFGNSDYDAEAPLDFVPVETAEEFTQALQEGKPVSLKQNITLTNNNGIKLDGSESQIQNLSIQGNGHTLDLSGMNDGANSILLIHQDIDTVKIDDVKLITDNYNNSALAFAYCTVDSIEVSNCEISGFKYGIWVANDNIVSKVNISNSHISAWASYYHYAANSRVTFDNCTLEGTNRHSGDSNGFATVVIEGGTNQDGTKRGYNNIFTFNNCTLIAENTDGSREQNILSMQYQAQNNTVYFNDCTIEQKTEGHIFHLYQSLGNDHVYVNEKEIKPNTNQIEYQ